MKTTRLIGTRCKCSDAFSQGVLIGRGLDQVLFIDTLFARRLLFSFEGAALRVKENM